MGPRSEDAGGRRHVGSGSPWEAAIGFSRAVRVGTRVVLSGTGPVLPGGRCPDGAGPQARRCFEIVAAALAEAGASLADVVRTRMYLTDAADAVAVGRVHAATFGDAAPAATMVVVAGLRRLPRPWRPPGCSRRAGRRSRRTPCGSSRSRP